MSSSELIQNRPLDIVSYAKSIIANRPINGCTGMMTSALKSVYQGNLVMADSAASALAVSKWTDENERMRLEEIFRYGTIELQNYNMEALYHQLALQGAAVRNAQEAVSSATIITETRWDPSLIANTDFLVVRPGYPEEMIDIRAIGANCASSVTGSNAVSRWRELTRSILSSILPPAAVRMYTGAKKAKNFIPFPSEVLRGIVECCVVGSSLTAEGVKKYSNTITTEVHKALQNRIWEVRKMKRGLTVRKLLIEAITVGWIPPGIDSHCEHADEDEAETGENSPSLIEILTGTPSSRVKWPMRGRVKRANSCVDTAGTPHRRPRLDSTECAARPSSSDELPIATSSSPSLHLQYFNVKQEATAAAVEKKPILRTMAELRPLQVLTHFDPRSTHYMDDIEEEESGLEGGSARTLYDSRIHGGQPPYDM